MSYKNYLKKMSIVNMIVLSFLSAEKQLIYKKLVGLFKKSL